MSIRKKEMIERKSIVLARAPEKKEQQREARDDVTAKVEERVVQKVAEGDDDQDEAERDKGVARAQAENPRARQR